MNRLKIGLTTQYVTYINTHTHTHKYFYCNYSLYFRFISCCGVSEFCYSPCVFTARNISKNIIIIIIIIIIIYLTANGLLSGGSGYNACT